MADITIVLYTYVQRITMVIITQQNPKNITASDQSLEQLHCLLQLI